MSAHTALDLLEPRHRNLQKGKERGEGGDRNQKQVIKDEKGHLPIRVAISSEYKYVDDVVCMDDLA